MELIEFIQKLFLILLPGIIGVLVINELTIHKEQHYYLELIRVFTYSFFSFLIPDILIRIINCMLRICKCSIRFETVDIVKHIASENFTIKTHNEIFAICCAILLSVLITKVKNDNLIFHIAHKLNITRRIDNQSVWDSVFDIDSIVVIRDFVTTNTYYGRVEKYSDNCENREILLKEVRVFDQEGTFLYECESLYLSRQHNEFSIEIYNYEDKSQESEEQENE